MRSTSAARLNDICSKPELLCITDATDDTCAGLKSSVNNHREAYRISKPNGNPIDKVKGEAKINPNVEDGGVCRIRAIARSICGARIAISKEDLQVDAVWLPLGDYLCMLIYVAVAQSVEL